MKLYLWPAGGARGRLRCLTYNEETSPYCRKNKGPIVHVGTKHSIKPEIRWVDEF